MYPECHTDDVAAWLDRSTRAVFATAYPHGLRKSAEYLASDSAGRVQRGKQSAAMIASQIKPGTIPWNKGRKGVNGRSCTTFKKGNIPQTWQPIGTVVTHSDGYLLRKVSDTRNRRADWVYIHREVWEAARGPIPAGHVVIFKPGRHTTEIDKITADALECIDRAELARRNSMWTRYPPEIARLHQLRGALNRQINKHSKELSA